MNALQPVYQVMNQGVLQDFINSLLVETIIPEQFIFDFATAQTALNQHGKNLQEVFKNTSEQFSFVLLHEESRQGLVMFAVQKVLLKPGSLLMKQKFFYWNAQMIMFRSM